MNIKSDTRYRKREDIEKKTNFYQTLNGSNISFNQIGGTAGAADGLFASTPLPRKSGAFTTARSRNAPRSTLFTTSIGTFGSPRSVSRKQHRVCRTMESNAMFHDSSPVRRMPMPENETGRYRGRVFRSKKFSSSSGSKEQYIPMAQLVKAKRNEFKENKDKYYNLVDNEQF